MSKLVNNAEIKHSMNLLIHETIHTLHLKSEALLDVEVGNDNDALKALHEQTNTLVTYLRLRGALDIE